MTIHDWLKSASQQLQDIGIASATLDAEIILAHTLRKNRTFLHAHASDILQSREHDIANARLGLRLDRTPVAYIIGHKEFYGRLFKVTPSTLIPRPESETIITLLHTIIPTIHAAHPSVVDVGTGTGCLGITAKCEFPKTHVTLIDTNNHTLNVAKTNATHLKADVSFLQSNLLDSFYPQQADIIIANLPYVSADWEVSPETIHEPKAALYAPDEGLFLINELIKQTPQTLKANGHLILEADPRQHKAIVQHCLSHNLHLMQKDGFILHFISRK